VGIGVLDLVRRRFGVRRDYESLYALGIALTAYAAAEAVHGSGFLAAFAAGLTVAMLDVELCDCFLDYGQATAEMFLLFTFVAFGSGLIWTSFEVLNPRTLTFALFALAIRSAVLWIALPRDLDRASRRLIVWFGPRGLSSLLLVLLPVFASAPESDQLLPLCALVVLLSVAVHGVALMVIARRDPPHRAAAGLPPGPRSLSARGTTGASQDTISIAQYRDLLARGEPTLVLDVRKERAFRESPAMAQGAVRLPPDRAAPLAAELALPREAWLVAYCA
jgi:hypothetical protein